MFRARVRSAPERRRGLGSQEAAPSARPTPGAVARSKPGEARTGGRSPGHAAGGPGGGGDSCQAGGLPLPAAETRMGAPGPADSEDPGQWTAVVSRRSKQAPPGRPTPVSRPARVRIFVSRRADPEGRCARGPVASRVRDPSPPPASAPRPSGAGVAARHRAQPGGFRFRQWPVTRRAPPPPPRPDITPPPTPRSPPPTGL